MPKPMNKEMGGKLKCQATDESPRQSNEIYAQKL